MLRQRGCYRSNFYTPADLSPLAGVKLKFDDGHLTNILLLDSVRQRVSCTNAKVAGGTGAENPSLFF